MQPAYKDIGQPSPLTVEDEMFLGSSLTAVIAGVMMALRSTLFSNIESLSGLLLGSIIVMFVSLIMLFCFSRVHPMNVILLTVFTGATGFLVGFCCMLYDTETVVTAGIITMFLFYTLTVYTYRSATYSVMSQCLTLLLAALVGYIALIFIPLSFDMFYKLYCILGALVFSIYIVVDTYFILTLGRLCPSSQEDVYTFAAIIYLDIINLFLKILALLGKK
ncbi:hypothetical protein PCE1_004289 [Barthelona sp. PCE]